MAVLFAPWASVDLLGALGLPGIGPGVQPAYLPLLLLILVVAPRARTLERGETAILVAVFWMIAASALTWSVVDMGLAGERPWSKSLKQLVQWLFFVAAAVAVARVVARERSAAVERSLVAGLLAVCLLAIVRSALGPDRFGVGILDTNPSIASGSDELYLGHSFTGIARLKGAMPEPLMFGSYLLAATPLVALAAAARRGWARWFRAGVALLGLVCLFGTWSRGAWLGAFATCAAVGVLLGRGRFGPPSFGRLSRWGGVGLLLGLVVAGVALQLPPWEVPGLLIRRIGQSLAGHDMSNMTRVWAWRAAWEAFLAAPVQGHGWGSYGFLFYRYGAEAASGAHFGWPVPNNLGLLLLAETGLFGFGAWCVALAPALSGLVDRRRGAVAALLACAMVGVLVQLATFSQWNLPHLWLLFGAALGAARAAPGEA